MSPSVLFTAGYGICSVCWTPGSPPVGTAPPPAELVELFPEPPDALVRGLELLPVSGGALETDGVEWGVVSVVEAAPDVVLAGGVPTPAAVVTADSGSVARLRSLGRRCFLWCLRTRRFDGARVVVVRTLTDCARVVMVNVGVEAWRLTVCDRFAFTSPPPSTTRAPTARQTKMIAPMTGPAGPRSRCHILKPRIAAGAADGLPANLESALSGDDALRSAAPGERGCTIADRGATGAEASTRASASPSQKSLASAAAGAGGATAAADATAGAAGSDTSCSG